MRKCYIVQIKEQFFGLLIVKPRFFVLNAEFFNFFYLLSALKTNIPSLFNYKIKHYHFVK